MEERKRKRPFKDKVPINPVEYFGPSDLEEEFREYYVEGYGNFLVNNWGTRVYGKRGNLLTIYRNQNGYLIIHTGVGGGKNHKDIQFTIHRLVALTFLPNPNNLPEINHKDGNKFNNCITNLEWCTPSENTRHAVRIGIKGDFRGSKNGRARLNEDQVAEIKHLLRDSNLTTAEIAEKYNVSKQIIYNIRVNTTWKHVII